MGLKPDGSITISFSELNTYIACPHQHKLKYLLMKDVREEKDVLAYGTAVHLGVQSLWSYSVEESQNRFIECLVNGFERLNKTTFDAYLNKGVELVGRFAKLQYHTRLKLIDIEFQLRESISRNIYFSGFIDALLYDEERKRFVVVDFKTTARGWAKAMRHDKSKLTQLYLYKYFIHKIFGFPYEEIDCEFVFLRGDNLTIEIFPVQVSEAQAEAAYRAVLLALKMIYIEKRNSYKNRSSCFFCMFKNKPECDRFSKPADFVDTSSIFKIIPFK